LTILILVLRYWLGSHRQREQWLAEQVRERTLQLERALDEVERASRIDGLTAVANRGYFDEHLARSWEKAEAEGTPLGLLMLDLDRFKQLNDTHGHQVGDDALRYVAQALVASVHRSDDLVARYGGEEFVVLLPGATLESVGQMAEAMRQAIADLSTQTGVHAMPAMTASAGCASVMPRDGVTAKDLIRAADNALYRAKRSGRNRVELASDFGR
ncbi:MAG: diguanylate cyclase, partial [Pseudomonadota bacterium]